MSVSHYLTSRPFQQHTVLKKGSGGELPGREAAVSCIALSRKWKPERPHSFTFFSKWAQLLVVSLNLPGHLSCIWDVNVLFQPCSAKNPPGGLLETPGSCQVQIDFLPTHEAWKHSHVKQSVRDPLLSGFRGSRGTLSLISSSSVSTFSQLLRSHLRVTTLNVRVSSTF